MESRSAVNFLDFQSKDMDDILNNQFKAFKEFNNNQQIAFMDSNKIDSFIKKYIEFFNNSLNLSQKKKMKQNKELELMDSLEMIMKQKISQMFQKVD